MTHEVSRHLRLEVDDYDASIRQFIPGYETMLDEVAGRVAAVLPDLAVDLGAGTGALSHAIAERAGVGRVQLLDVDAAMLAKARQRLAPFGERIILTEGSYDDDLPAADAFAASISLHHVRTIEQKRDLFARVFEALRPGGVFVNADANMPDDPDERDTLYRFWIDHMGRHGITEERARQHFDDWAEEDTYLPLEHEIAALAEVGFDARCVWQAGPMSVVVARRPLA